MTTSFRKILFIKWHKTHRLTSIKISVSDIYPTFANVQRINETTKLFWLNNVIGDNFLHLLPP